MKNSILKTVIAFGLFNVAAANVANAEPALVRADGKVAPVHACRQNRSGKHEYQAAKGGEWSPTPSELTCAQSSSRNAPQLSQQDIISLFGAAKATDYNSSRSNKSF